MPISTENSVLRQKTNQSGTSQKSGLHAFGRSLVRAAETELGLKIVVLSEECVELDLQEVLEGSPSMLHLVLDGPDGQTGAMLLDCRFVVHVTELLTMGQSSDGGGRPLTRTDAALLQPFVDRALSRFEAVNSDACGFRFGAYVKDAHALGNLLESTCFKRCKVLIELASGGQPVEISYIFPAQSLISSDTHATDTRPSLSHLLRQKLEETRVTTHVSLCNIRLSFEQIQKLQPGESIEIPKETLGQATLMLSDKIVAEGKLGQLNGFRAIKIVARQSVPLQSAPDSPAGSGTHSATSKPELVGSA